jgi:hypothetical protein
MPGLVEVVTRRYARQRIAARSASSAGHIAVAAVAFA